METFLKALVTVFGILFRGLFSPPATVHAYHSGDPTDANCFVSVCNLPNEAFATAPVAGYGNGTIISCPANMGKQLLIRAIQVSNYQAAIDATDDVTIVIKTVTSAGAAKATIVAATSIKSTAVANKSTLSLLSGAAAVLLPGESAEFEITATTPDTAGFGYQLATLAELQSV